MSDIVSKKKRSQVMAAIHSKGNKATELKLISIFRTHGITGWRRSQKALGNPDFVFHRERLAVFVDGCFWHGCPIHCRKPSSNLDYWLTKIRRNQERDSVVRNGLCGNGWRVARIWEHELRFPRRVAWRITLALQIADQKRSLHQKSN